MLRSAAHKDAEHLTKTPRVREAVRIFLRSLGLRLDLAALRRPLQSSPPAVSAAPECKQLVGVALRILEGSVFWSIWSLFCIYNHALETYTRQS